jgi:hypothetical protein
MSDCIHCEIHDLLESHLQRRWLDEVTDTHRSPPNRH